MADGARGGRIRAGRAQADARHRTAHRITAAFASLFDIDPDLVAAAAESSAGHAEIVGYRAALDRRDDGRREERVSNALVRRRSVVGPELRLKVRERQSAHVVAVLAYGRELRARAEEIRIASEREEAEREAAEEKRKAEEAEKVRRARIDSIVRRGASVWREVEAEIELRNAKSYAKAVELLRDLRTLADDREGMQDFQPGFARSANAIRPSVRLSNG